MPRGCIVTSSPWAGIRSCASSLRGKVRPLGAERFDWLSTLVPKPGTAWSGVVDCFVEKTVRCTLLACWQEGYADAWLVLTDLAPEAANGVWYCMRGWIEGGGRRYQTWGLAVASNQDDRSGTCYSTVVSYRSSDLMGDQRGRRSRCDRAGQRIGCLTRVTYCSTQNNPPLPASHAELLCTRPATHLGGFARRALAAGQTLLSRALARDSAPAQTTHQATFPQATSDHPASECPSFPFGGRLMLKNLPVKGSGGCGGRARAGWRFRERIPAKRE